MTSSHARELDARELDLVLLGATGYVGRLAAQQLAEQAPAGLRLGLAGRSADRLAALAADLGSSAQEWPRLTVDSTDPAAVSRLAQTTRVVATTVGPYLRYGLPLVEACAAAGTHYADLTGETLFVRRSIDAAAAPASASGARLVHACGFDSIPSDLGVGLCAARAAADGRGRLLRATLYVRSMRAGVSGGTIDSLRQQVVESRVDAGVRALTADPAALTDDAPEDTLDNARGAGRPPRPRSRKRGPVQRDPRTGRWQTPFVMGGFNRQIVLRSNSLTGLGYGPDFDYHEVVDTGRGLSGAVAAGLLAAGSTALLGGMSFGPTRRLLDRMLPDPGQGPSEQTRRDGRFLVEVVAETADGGRYATRIGADLDPGYAATAVMLTQSALALALDDDLPDRSGVLTPMTALGEPLARRLVGRGFTVSTERLE